MLILPSPHDGVNREIPFPLPFLPPKDGISGLIAPPDEAGGISNVCCGFFSPRGLVSLIRFSPQPAEINADAVSGVHPCLASRKNARP